MKIEVIRRLPALMYVMYIINSCKPTMTRGLLYIIEIVRTVMYRVCNSAEEPVAYRVDANYTRTLLVATPGMRISVQSYLKVIMEDSMITRVPEHFIYKNCKLTLSGVLLSLDACGGPSVTKNKQQERSLNE